MQTTWTDISFYIGYGILFVGITVFSCFYIGSLLKDKDDDKFKKSVIEEKFKEECGRYPKTYKEIESWFNTKNYSTTEELNTQAYEFHQTLLSESNPIKIKKAFGILCKKYNNCPTMDFETRKKVEEIIKFAALIINGSNT
jgi:hypothetical protein